MTQTHQFTDQPDRTFRVLEAIKLLTTFVALSVTKLVYDHPQTVEYAAGAAALIETVGWSGAAAIVGVTLMALFMSLWTFAGISRWGALGIASAFAGFSTVNAVNDVWVASQVDVSVSMGWLAFVGVVGVGWLVLFFRYRVVSVVSGFSYQRVRKVVPVVVVVGVFFGMQVAPFAFVMIGSHEGVAVADDEDEMVKVDSDTGDGAGSIWSFTYALGYIYSGGLDGNALKINPDTMEREGKYTGHSDAVTATTYGDGYIYSGSRDTEVHKIDPDTMEKVGDPYTGHSDDVEGLTYGGGYIYSASWDGQVHRIDPDTMEQVGDPYTGHEGLVMAITYGDGYIYSGGNFPELHRVNPVTMEKEGEYTGHSGQVYTLEYGDGYLYTGSTDEEAHRINPDTMENEGKYTGHSDNIRALAYGDGHLYTGSLDTEVHRLNADTMEYEANYTGHSGHIRALKYRDGYIYSASRDGEAHKIDPGTEIPPDTAVSGVVTDTADDPIEGATVSIDDDSTTTDADGTYELELDDEGTYTIEADAPGFQADTRTETVPEDGLEDVDFQLSAEDAQDVSDVVDLATLDDSELQFYNDSGALVGHTSVSNPRLLEVDEGAARAYVVTDDDVIGYDLLSDTDGVIVEEAFTEAHTLSNPVDAQLAGSRIIIRSDDDQMAAVSTSVELLDWVWDQGDPKRDFAVGSSNIHVASDDQLFRFGHGDDPNEGFSIRDPPDVEYHEVYANPAVNEVYLVTDNRSELEVRTDDHDFVGTVPFPGDRELVDPSRDGTTTLDPSPDGTFVTFSAANGDLVTMDLAGTEQWHRDSGPYYQLDWDGDSAGVWATPGTGSDDSTLYEWEQGVTIEEIDVSLSWSTSSLARPVEAWDDVDVPPSFPPTEDDEHAGQLIEAPPDDPLLDSFDPGPHVPFADITISQNGQVVDETTSDWDGFFVVEDIDEDGDFYDLEVRVGDQDNLRVDREVFIDPDENEQYGVPMTDPTIDSASAWPQGETVSTDGGDDISLLIDVEDPDFPSERVNVSFYEFETGDPAEDERIGRDRLTQNGTAFTTYTLDPANFSYAWYAVAEDSYNYTADAFSDVFEFDREIDGPLVDPDTASPHDEEREPGEEVDLEIDVDHVDFPDENVTVEFYDFETGNASEDELVGSTELTEAGTASVPVTLPSDPEDLLFEWYVVAEDEDFGVTTTDVFWVFIDEEEFFPQLDDSSASPDDEVIDTQDAVLEIDVDHELFDENDEEVTVEFYEFASGDPDNDELIGSDTRTEAGTASTTWPGAGDEGGEWYAVAEDSDGDTDISSVFIFYASGELQIRDGDDGELVDDRTVRLDIIGDGLDTTVNVTDGVLDYADLGVDPQADVLIDVSAQDYYSATLQPGGLINQDTIFIERCPDWVADPEDDDPLDTCDPDDDEGVVLIRFELIDRTGGDFPPANSTLEVEKRGNDTVHSETFGSLNRVDVILERNERYHLHVRGPVETRSLGGFTASESETVPITIDGRDYEFPEDGTYSVDAFTEEEGGITFAVFEFSDPHNETQLLDVEIHERIDPTNIIYETGESDLGNLTVRVPLSEDQENKQWIVAYEGLRDGQPIQGQIPIGGDDDIPLPGGAILTAFVILGLTLGAALYTGPLASFGSLVLVGGAGVAMLFGWLPISPAIWFVALVVAVAGVARTLNNPVR